jgi:predicted dehydrogenase
MWRRDPVAAAKNCADYGIAHNFATREALCESPEIDAVFITSPDAMHYADTLLALKHGKAVLCEKPLSMHAPEAEEMVSTAESAGLLFGVAQNFRYNRSLERMRQQILAGRIGTPQLAQSVFNYPADLAPRTWISDLDLACGGPIADVGVHCIDSLRYVLDQDVVSISTLARATDSHPNVDSFASLQMAMTGGVFASVTVSARSPYRTLVEVTGSEGILTAESGLNVDRPVEVVLRRGSTIVEQVTVDNGDGYTRMLDAFAQASHGEGTFLATGADGVQNMRALDAAYASWHSGRTQTI